MTNPMIKIHNIETGEVIEREMTKAELEQKVQDEKIARERDEQFKAQAAQKAALLEQLGITEDQAKLLLG